jgi:hypothetical protein
LSFNSISFIEQFGRKNTAMHSPTQPTSKLERLESWQEIARSLDYRIRHEHFGGSGGGFCEVHGQKWIFMDVSLSTEEQLALIEETVSSDPQYNRWVDSQRAA